jgi:hypothetical protein
VISALEAVNLPAGHFGNDGAWLLGAYTSRKKTGLTQVNKAKRATSIIVVENYWNRQRRYEESGIDVHIDHQQLAVSESTQTSSRAAWSSKCLLTEVTRFPVRLGLCHGLVAALARSKPKLLIMLGQENQTKHLNVCLVQHRLEEGSEVV